MGCGRGHQDNATGINLALHPLQLKSYSHDLGKEPRRLPRHRRVAPEAEPSRRSARNVRLFLRHFCQDFLEGCYNRLMLLVKVSGWERRDPLSRLWSPR